VTILVRLFRLLPVLVLALWALPTVAQERVGVTTAVNPEAIGAHPGGATRPIVIGQDVVANEHISTGTAGQTQILFLDQSAMTIGPNSDLAIDRFVYDPKTGTGTLTMSTTRGVLRYIGGKISKNPDAVTIRSGATVVGIRGGVVLLEVSQAGKTDVIAIHPDGPTVVGQNGVSQILARDNDMVSVASPGGTPTPPTPAPSSLTSHLLSQLTISDH